MHVWLNIIIVMVCGAGLYTAPDKGGAIQGFTGLACFTGFLFAGGGIAWLCRALKAAFL